MELFAEIPCLIERSSPFKGIDLIKKYFRKGDKRALAELLQKFIAYNSVLLEFLGVQPTIEGTGPESKLVFRSSCYVGAIPLRAPDTGKQVGDFVVSPRFVGRDRFEDYIEILDLLGSEISPEVIESLPLVSGRNFRPPIYLEAVRYISSLENLVEHQWRRFDCIEKDRAEPTGQINWRKYSGREFDPGRRLKFPVKTNVLSEIHSEYAQLRYVFDICNLELMSSSTPQRLRNAFRNRLAYLEKKLYLHKPQPAETIAIRSSDSPPVRDCKLQANQILQRKLVDSTAWRVDFNDVFEKFVQHIFGELARSVGGRVLVNPRIRSRSSSYHAWEQKELEPDAIVKIGEFFVFIDAKYKSHMFNRVESTVLLREDFRRDLHQILAYTSFGKDDSKLGVLCYPSYQVETKLTQYRNPFNDATNQVLIAGIPLRRSIVTDAVQTLLEDLQFTRLGRAIH